MQEGEQQRDSTTHTHVTILPQAQKNDNNLCALFYIKTKPKVRLAHNIEQSSINIVNWLYPNAKCFWC